MLRGAVIAVTLFAVLMGQAEAEAQRRSKDQDARVVMGAGGESCAAFTASYRFGFVEQEFFIWAQGFMSGLNATAAARNMKSVDLDSPNFGVWEQRRAIRLYCDQKPLAPYFSAVLDLYDAMRARQEDLSYLRPRRPSRER